MERITKADRRMAAARRLEKAAVSQTRARARLGVALTRHDAKLDFGGGIRSLRHEDWQRLPGAVVSALGALISEVNDAEYKLSQAAVALAELEPPSTRPVFTGPCPCPCSVCAKDRAERDGAP